MHSRLSIAALALIIAASTGRAQDVGVASSPAQRLNYWGLPEEPRLPLITLDESPAPPPWVFNASIRTFQTWGTSQMSFAGDLVNPISRLTWRDTVSQTIELELGAVAHERFVIGGQIGYGGVSGGTLQDEDFARRGRRQILFSDTLSPNTDQDLLYGNLDLGWRVYNGEEGAVLDVLVGLLAADQKCSAAAKTGRRTKSAAHNCAVL